MTLTELDNILYSDVVDDPSILTLYGIDLEAFNYNLKDTAQSPNWVHQYAYECLTKYKDETCLNIKLAAVRHIIDMERSKDPEFKYVFNAQSARKVINFYKLLCHVKNESGVFKLLPWQQFIVGSIFGWVKKEKRGERVLRRFTDAHVFVARKNGKSTLACGIALYMLLMDGEVGADVYTSGPTGKQAKFVFDDSKKMLKKSMLSKAFGVRMNNDAIYCDALDAKMEYKNSIPDNLDGLNSHLICLDEIHSFTSDAVYNVMRTSLGARNNPLMFVISTAGTNLGAIGHRLFGDGEDQLRNVVKRSECDHIFNCLYTIDKGDAFDSVAAWHKSNPSLRSGARKYEEIENEANTARRMISARPNFLTKYLNVFCNSSDKWLEWEVIRDSTDINLKMQDYIQSDVPCYLGVDIGLTSDLSAIGYAFVHPDGSVKCFSKAFFPRDALDNIPPAQAEMYVKWANMKDGSFELTEGGTCDFELMEDDIRYACKVFNVQSVELDPYNANQMHTNLVKAKINAIKRHQGFKDLNEPTKVFEKKILDGDLKHDGNGALMWCMGNACIRTTQNDCITVEKDSQSSNYKIDCVKALVIALAGFVHQEAKKESPWKKGRSRIVSI
ncbi:terminase large subunit [Aeromonas salmonicida]|uniref:terminase large subunit n=1 Tax=Aeromonas TaxID=642 RepID=UPI0002F4FD02|nr:MULTISPECIES: terminase TerL endonuclease subunit [Aeromonas]MBL0603798.1 terminase large subunit [Aeromonas dhakensis]